MRLVVASDSFKGSLSSVDIARIVSDVAVELCPTVEVIALPMADGGEGTVEALIRATGGTRRSARVTGPLWEAVDAAWGLLPDGTAIIEMAAASGLPLVPGVLRNPLLTTTYGTGELMRVALDVGATKVMLSIGGSATNDGGMGMLSALGVAFYDAAGTRLRGTGDDLVRVARINTDGIDARLSRAVTCLTVMCDVDNPLLGPDGAAATFAQQKGADAKAIRTLESGMDSYARVVTSTLGLDFDAAVGSPGAGAAGGLGFALSSFLGATMVPGVEAVLGAVAFDERIADADLVITGEGRLDAQTAHGKMISGVAGRCARAGIPCVAIVGSMTPDADIGALGLTDAIATAPQGLPLPEAMSRAEELYVRALRQVLVDWCATLES